LNQYSQSAIANPFQRYAIWLHPLACFIISLVVYYATLPRTITLEDAGLFQLVCHLGGISHPPGYPLYTMLCNPFVQSLDLANKVLAGNLLSAFFASSTVAVFHHVCFLWRDRNFAWVASMAYAFSATFWSQAIVIEVYSLAVLMFVSCVWAVLKYSQTGDIRYWYVLGFLYGLALSNHWPMMILSTPVLVILLAGSFQRLRGEMTRPQFWLLSILCGLLGLSPYISLMYDSEPVIAVYGGIHSLEQLYFYVTRSIYPDGSEIASYSDRLKFFGWIVQSSLSQFGYWAAPFILTGIVVSVRSLSLIFNLALVFMYAGCTIVLLLLLDFEFGPFNRAIFAPYPLISYLAVSMWFAIGFQTFKDLIEKRQMAVNLSRALPLVGIALVLISNYGRNNRSEGSFTEKYVTSVLESLPNDSLLLLYGDFETGLFGYSNLVQLVRPDIEVREWKNLVFSNRLASPFASAKVRDEKIVEFINSTNRPLFSLSSRFSQSTNFGFYHRYDPLNKDSVDINVALSPFVTYLIDLYKDDLLSDPHERILSFHLLVNISRAYLRVVQQRSEGWEVALQHLEELKDTFPAKFAMLETAVEYEHLDAEQINALLVIAENAEEKIPDMIDRERIAQFYEYYARLLLKQNESRNSAFHYFEKSIRTYPSKGNPSICQLRSLTLDKKLVPSTVLKRFKAVSCVEMAAE
jgi:hypothetical protein